MVSSDRIVAYRYLFKMPKIYECRRSYTTPRGKPSPTRKIQHRGGPDREESQVLTRQFSGGISPSPGGEARRRVRKSEVASLFAQEWRLKNSSLMLSPTQLALLLAEFIKYILIKTCQFRSSIYSFPKSLSRPKTESWRRRFGLALLAMGGRARRGAPRVFWGWCRETK